MNITFSSSPNVDFSLPWEVWEIWRLMGHDERTAKLLGEPVVAMDDEEWARRIGCVAFRASEALRVLESMGLIRGDEGKEAPRG